jgi:hypothetical protein
VTGTACCDRNGRGICQRPPTTLAFEIRSPAPTKPPTKAPVTKPPSKPPTKAPKAPTKPPTKAPTKPPTKAPTKYPTKAPMQVCTVPGYDGDRDGCCGAGVLAARSGGNCCQPGEIVRFNPQGIYKVPVQTSYFFDVCCPQEAAVLIAGPFPITKCCPAGTALIGLLGFPEINFEFECCKPGDILVPSVPSFGSDFCCPNKTIAVSLYLNVDGNPASACCPPSTGVNRATYLCCADGQMECTPKPSSSCAVIGNDGDGDSCCGANVTAVSSNYECCEPGQIVVFSNKTQQGLCCPPNTTGVDSYGRCCPAGSTLFKVDLVESVSTPDEICCPAGTTVLDIDQNCCPPSTGLNPVTQQCCPDGQKECANSFSCPPGQIVSFSNPIGKRPRIGRCCPAGQLVVNSVGNCCANTTILTKLPDQTEKCCPIGTTLADINRKCCKPGEILSPFLQPGSPAVYCCPAGTNVSAYNAIFSPSCCPPNTGANLITEKCCPAGQMTC